MFDAMKYAIFLLSAVISFNTHSKECRTYTEEQQSVLNLAFEYGKLYGYEYTLAAIVTQESFIGDQVVRYHPNDPSTGITAIHFPTLRHLGGLNYWDAMKEGEVLIKDDLLALHYAVKKLQSVHTTTYWNAWKRYNGSGKAAEQYANNINANIKQLKKCKVFTNFG